MEDEIDWNFRLLNYGHQESCQDHIWSMVHSRGFLLL